MSEAGEYLPHAVASGRITSLTRAQIDALYQCCNLFYQRNGDEASVVSCPKANLLRLKMKQRAESVE